MNRKSDIRHIMFRNIILGTVASLSFVSCLTDKDSSSSSSDLTIGQALPQFTANVLISDTADWRYSNTQSFTFDSKSASGRQTVIAFFNTTCPDCQRELPVLQQFYDEIKTDTAMSLLCISRAQTKEEVVDYWSQYHLNLPVSPQPDRRIYEMFASSGIPRIYIADKRGTITHAYSDKDTLEVDDLRKTVAFVNNNITE